MPWTRAGAPWASTNLPVTSPANLEMRRPLELPWCAPILRWTGIVQPQGVHAFIVAQKPWTSMKRSRAGAGTPLASITASGTAKSNSSKKLL